MNRNTQSPLMRYRIYLQLEKSLQPNTVEAYIGDVNKLLSFFGNADRLLAVTLDDLREFLSAMADVGVNARSQARIISSLRSFYGFLKLDGYIGSDPTAQLRSPKIGMRLPDVLTLQEIDDIINAIDLATCEGQRNRAIIEVLYSCGLRVSELCSLRMSDLYLKEQFIRVTGKGGKQRLVGGDKAFAGLEGAACYLKGHVHAADGLCHQADVLILLYCAEIGSHQVCKLAVCFHSTDQYGTERNIFPGIGCQNGLIVVQQVGNTPAHCTEACNSYLLHRYSPSFVQ